MAPGAPSLTTRATASRARATAVVRVGAVLLLVGSVATGVQAAWSRWAVCYVDADRPVPGLPADRAGACEALQDHRYDYMLPSDPWVPIADAAQREGLSYLALGLAIVLVAVTVVDRWFVRALGAAVAVIWPAMGVPTLLSGLAGEPVTYFLPAAGALFFLTPLVTLGLGVGAALQGTADGRLVGLFWLAVTVAQPLPEFFITGMLWGSYDSSPLTGFVRCAAGAGAAMAIAMTLLPASRRPARVRRRLKS